MYISEFYINELITELTKNMFGVGWNNLSKKINAPTMAYITVYKKRPSPPIRGKEAEHRGYLYNGIKIDEHIPKESIIKLNNIKEIELRSSCQGSNSRLLTFLIFT